jgi:hypothetical protein
MLVVGDCFAAIAGARTPTTAEKYLCLMNAFAELSANCLNNIFLM